MNAPKCPACGLPMEFGWKPILWNKAGDVVSAEAAWKCCCGGERAYKAPMPSRRARKALERAVTKGV